MEMDRTQLEKAYRVTEYRVEASEGRFILRIDEPCPAADELVRRHGAATWAYVTAHNPWPAIECAAENERRQAELEIRVAAFPCYRGESVGDSGTHPPEQSVFIIGISETDAARLAREFGQAAIVVGDVGAPARLKWL